MELFTYQILYHWYKLPVSRLVRALFLLVVLIFIVLGIPHGTFPHLPIFFLSCFLILETFYRFRVTRTKPRLPVSENIKDIYLSFTFQALDAFFFSPSTQSILRHVLTEKSVQYMLKRANISQKDIVISDIPKESLAQKAFEIVQKVGGTYVTRMDLFAAYILLSEEKTKLLFQKHLQADEFLHILYWARYDFPQEENPAPTRVIFFGEGIADSITVGWTNETNKYIADVTYQALKDKPTVLGYKTEFQRVVATLASNGRNNVLLVGQPGVGKRSIVETFALQSFIGLLPRSLYHKRVYQLLINLLVSGVETPGALEQRIETLIQEVLHAQNIVLYLEDIENILGSDTFHTNLSATLMPYLRNSKLPIIATITPETYKLYEEKSQGFLELFTVVELREPSVDDTKQLMLEKANELESKNNVTITYKAIMRSVDLAHKFIRNKVLPGSAVSLLTRVIDTAKQEKRTLIDDTDVTKEIETMTHVTLSAPGEQERTVLLHLEEELHKRIIGQDTAVSSVSAALQRVRAGVVERDRPISFLFLGPTGVGKTETAKALAKIYFGGEDRIIRLDMSEYTGSDSLTRLLGAQPGREDERGELTEKVSANPFSLVLLDEFEKASSQVLDLFLQILDDGRLTDNKGRLVSFSNTIIIATSNAGALEIEEQVRNKKELDAPFQKQLIQNLEKDHVFKPELINRFDGVILFHSLSQDQLEHIADIYLADISKDLLKMHDIALTIDPSVISYVAEKGQDVEFGARPLRRFIQDTVENMLAKLMLSNDVQRGDHIKIFIDDKGTLQWQKT